MDIAKYKKLINEIANLRKIERDEGKIQSLEKLEVQIKILLRTFEIQEMQGTHFFRH